MDDRPDKPEHEVVQEATLTLTTISEGDASGAETLFGLIYSDLHALAASYFRRQPSDHTLQPTALVHEAFLRLINQMNVQWNDRAHFFAVAATAMRQILVNHAEQRATLKRGGDRQRLSLEDSDGAGAAIPVEDVLAMDEAMKALAEMDARKCGVVEMRIFGGLTMEEIAHVQDVSKTTVESDWRMARAWLSRRLSEETAHDAGTVPED